MADDDDTLIRALQAEHGDALFAHALRLCDVDRQRAEDLVQEILLRAWRHPEALDPERGSARAWLFTTARHLAIDAWRRREARVGEVFTDTPPEPRTDLDEADRDPERRYVLATAMAADRLMESAQEIRAHLVGAARSVAAAMDSEATPSL